MRIVKIFSFQAEQLEKASKYMDLLKDKFQKRLVNFLMQLHPVLQAMVWVGIWGAFIYLVYLGLSSFECSTSFEPPIAQ